MSFSITGKTVIVTGAASGVGLAVARHFLDRGARLICADSDDAKLQAAFQGREREDGANLQLFAGDLTGKLAQANLISTALEAWGSIDVLINGGFRSLTGDPLDCTDDQTEALFSHNVLAPLRLSQMVAKRMLAVREAMDSEADLDEAATGMASGEADIHRGAIITLAAPPDLRRGPFDMGTAVSAAAVIEMVQGLALALAPRGVRVNAICAAGVMGPKLQAALKSEPGLREMLEASIPLARIASPDELVEAVQFLASDAARFMTGQVMTLDGGLGLGGRLGTVGEGGAPAF